MQSGLCLRKRLDIVFRWDDYMHFVYEEGYDGIDEMLQSHDSNKLISKLRKEYPKYVNIEIGPDTSPGRDNLGWLYIEPRYTEKVILPASSRGSVRISDLSPGEASGSGQITNRGVTPRGYISLRVLRIR